MKLLLTFTRWLVRSPHSCSFDGRIFDAVRHRISEDLVLVDTSVAARVERGSFKIETRDLEA